MFVDETSEGWGLRRAGDFIGIFDKHMALV